MLRSLAMAALLLSASLLAGPTLAEGRQELALGVGANGSPGSFAQRAGPRLSAGALLPLSERLLGGARLGLGYEANINQVLEVNLQLVVQRTGARVEPYAGLGTNVFGRAGMGAHLFATVGAEFRFVPRLRGFFELTPGVLSDRFGWAPWLGTSLGLRLAFGAAGHSR